MKLDSDPDDELSGCWADTCFSRISLHFSHSVRLDVSAHFSALDDEEFFVVEGSGWRERRESDSQVFCRPNSVHARVAVSTETSSWHLVRTTTTTTFVAFCVKSQRLMMDVELESATHHGLRAQKTPPPGERPGIFAEPGPQQGDRTVRRSAGDALPTLGLPVLSAAEGGGPGVGEQADEEKEEKEEEEEDSQNLFLLWPRSSSTTSVVCPWLVTLVQCLQCPLRLSAGLSC